MAALAHLAATVKAISSGDPAGEFEAVLSAPSVDRDGEVVMARAFEATLPDHITIDVDHALKASGVVGSGRPYYAGDRLMIKGTFATTQLGQEVRALVTGGHIRTMSVAFHKAEKEVKSGITYIRKASLLNASFVAVPANPDALVVSAKNAAQIRRNAVDDTTYRVRGGLEISHKTLKLLAWSVGVKISSAPIGLAAAWEIFDHVCRVEENRKAYEEKAAHGFPIDRSPSMATADPKGPPVRCILEPAPQDPQSTFVEPAEPWVAEWPEGTEFMDDDDDVPTYGMNGRFLGDESPARSNETPVTRRPE